MNLPLSSSDWRNDPGLSALTEYKRKFALWPIICEDGTRVWFKHYYKKYKHWGHYEILAGYENIPEDNYVHTEYIENVSESKYIVRKLAENL